MANTYTLIASSTVGAGGASNIEFTSIPSTYTDLKLVTSLRMSSSGQWYTLKFNNSTSTYSDRYLLGSGSSAASGIDGGQPALAGSAEDSTYTANTFANSENYIPNYTSSNYKSYSGDGVQENNATASYMAFWANLWSTTSAITSIKIEAQGGVNFVQYSTAYLYGISNS